MFCMCLFDFAFFFFPHTKPVSSLRTTIYFFSHAFIFEQKNALSYACQISECTAALQVSHIRVVISGGKTPANVASVLFVCHAIEQIECVVWCWEGKWIRQYVHNCAVQILPV